MENCAMLLLFTRRWSGYTQPTVEDNSFAWIFNFPFTHTHPHWLAHMDTSSFNVCPKRSKPTPATSCVFLRQLITHWYILVDRHILSPCRLNSCIFLFNFSLQPSPSFFKLISPRSLKQNACIAIKCNFIHGGASIDKTYSKTWIFCLQLAIDNFFCLNSLLSAYILHKYKFTFAFVPCKPCFHYAIHAATGHNFSQKN